MKSQLSSLDICFLVRELSSIVGAKIDKVYQIGERDIKISLRAKEAMELVITPTYLCLTRFKHEAPQKPSNLAMLLRKHLSGGVIKSVIQHKFDRIVEIGIAGRGRLILEFFSRGNIMLVDESGIIRVILEGQEWKDRKLKAGLQYKYPPETPDVKNMSLSDFSIALADKKEIVRILASNLGLGSAYANEVLERAGVNANARADKDICEKVYAVLKDLLNSKTDARIIIGRNGETVDVVPFEMASYKGYEQISKPSFNEAVDEYFTGIRTEVERGEATSDRAGEIERLKRIIERQKETVSEMRESAEEFKRMGDTIYSNFQEIEDILRGIKEAKSSRKSWVAFLKESNIPIKDPASRRFEFKGVGVFVDKSVPENASYYYGLYKKAKSKLEGALEALKESERKLEMADGERVMAEKRVSEGPIERHRPEWFEKFRWFMSSDGFLIIGGRDAATNEILIKRHVEPNDLIFHSAVRGAPFFVVKNPKKREIPESTKREAAEAAASYSSAWGDCLGSVDVYAFKPEQISKTAESGEYLTKGAFVIRGEREWFRGTPLKLALGFRVMENYAIAIGGPESAVKSQAKHYVKIGVGNERSGELARRIKADILRKTNKEDGQKIKKVVLGEIQRWIPAGKGAIIK